MKKQDKLSTEIHEAPQATETPDAPVQTGAPRASAIARLWQWMLGHKKISMPAAVLVVLLILGAIPFTRYALAGLVWKQDFSVLVVDSETNMPVARAQITLHGSSAFTDAKGAAKLHVAVGTTTLVTDKRYYKTTSQAVLVPIMRSGTPLTVKLQATGRQVPVTVINKITKKPVKGAIFRADGAETQTDEKGQAVLVVPASKTEVAAEISDTGFNKTSVNVKVTVQADPANTFAITPSGKVYFMSNQTGKVDVVKSDLDGGNRQVVMAGTGNEGNETALVASQDWKYLAFLSKRDGGANAKLFLIDTTAGDQVTTMDEGTATFTPIGWDGHHFIYTVYRTNIPDWQSKQTALKSYDAEAKKITALDEPVAQGTSANDYLKETIGSVYIFANGQIVYTKTWYATTFNESQLWTKQATLSTINADGSNHKVVRGFSILNGTYTSYLGLNTRPYEPNSLYLQSSNGQSNSYYEFENNALNENKTLTDDTFYTLPYHNYLVAPSNNQTFWSESRDGKSTLFIGDQDGKHAKQIMAGSALSPYGWFTDDYLLVSKDGSEMHIIPVGGVTADDQALKVSDYYKVVFLGYGKGY